MYSSATATDWLSRVFATTRIWSASIHRHGTWNFLLPLPSTGKSVVSARSPPAAMRPIRLQIVSAVLENLDVARHTHISPVPPLVHRCPKQPVPACPEACRRRLGEKR